MMRFYSCCCGYQALSSKLFSDDCPVCGRRNRTHRINSEQKCQLVGAVAPNGIIMPGVVSMRYRTGHKVDPRELFSLTIAEGGNMRLLSDCKMILTTPIESVKYNGDVWMVKTASGTHYVLGKE